MTSTLQVKAFQLILPSTVQISVVDTAWHLKGDINWDGVIDQNDVALMTAAQGSSPGSSNWNSDCDLNGDGKVDILDALILAANMGKTAPQYPTPFTVTVLPGRCILIGTSSGKTLKSDLKVADKTSQKIIFEYNAVNGRVMPVPSLLSGFGASLPSLPGLPKTTTYRPLFQETMAPEICVIV